MACTNHKENEKCMQYFCHIPQGSQSWWPCGLGPAATWLLRSRVQIPLGRPGYLTLKFVVCFVVLPLRWADHSLRGLLPGVCVCVCVCVCLCMWAGNLKRGGLGPSCAVGPQKIYPREEVQWETEAYKERYYLTEHSRVCTTILSYLACP